MCVWEGGKEASVEGRWTTQVGRREEAKRGGKPGLGDQVQGDQVQGLSHSDSSFPKGWVLSD